MTTNDPEEVNSQAQSGDGYLCSCDFITDDKTKFLLHIAQGNKRDGKGFHQSKGRINMETGEITMPPVKQRTKEQLRQSKHAKRTQKDSEGKVIASRSTDVLANATEVRFIPRIFTCTLTPIMIQGEHASRKWLGWPQLTFEDFLDTVIALAFKQWGIRLGEYGVDESLIKAATERENNPEVIQEV